MHRDSDEGRNRHNRGEGIKKDFLKISRGPGGEESSAKMLITTWELLRKKKKSDLKRRQRGRGLGGGEHRGV